jgi:hypothetical protein
VAGARLSVRGPMISRLPGSLVAPMIPSPGESPGAWWANTGQTNARRRRDDREGRDPDAARPALGAYAVVHQREHVRACVDPADTSRRRSCRPKRARPRHHVGGRRPRQGRCPEHSGTRPFLARRNQSRQHSRWCLYGVSRCTGGNHRLSPADSPLTSAATLLRSVRKRGPTTSCPITAG